MKKEKEIVKSFLNFEDNDGVVQVPLFCTRNQKKRDLYAIDPYFREGYESAFEIFGDQLKNIALQSSAIVFKPDAIVNRKILETIKFLVKKEFTPIAYKTFTYNRHSIREDWRYQYNVATRNRIRAVDYLLQTSPSLVVFFKKKPKIYNNACEEMTKLKGHSNPKYRKIDDIRYQLKSINSLLNYIHTCDEPADLFRSLGLYFDDIERIDLLDDIKLMGNVWQNLNKVVTTLYDTYEKSNFNYLKTVNVLKKLLYKFSTDQQKYLEEICNNPILLSSKQWDYLYNILVVEKPGVLSRWETNILLTSSVKVSIENKNAIIN